MSCKIPCARLYVCAFQRMGLHAGPVGHDLLFDGLCAKLLKSSLWLSFHLGLLTLAHLVRTSGAYVSCLQTLPFHKFSTRSLFTWFCTRFYTRLVSSVGILDCFETIETATSEIIELHLSFYRFYIHHHTSIFQVII